MAQSVNKEKSIEQFCTFVGITIGIGVIPILENAANNVWLKTIFGLIIVFLIVYLVKAVMKYLMIKKIPARYTEKLLPLYVIYILVYTIIRLALAG